MKLLLLVSGLLSAATALPGGGVQQSPGRTAREAPGESISLSLEKHQEIYLQFKYLDKNRDMTISHTEEVLYFVNEVYGEDDEQAHARIHQKVKDTLDFDADGTITYEEFMQGMKTLKGMQLYLDTFDMNNDGVLQREEFGKLLDTGYGPPFSLEEIDGGFAFADADQNGEIDFQEFMGLIKAKEPYEEIGSSNYRDEGLLLHQFEEADVYNKGYLERTEVHRLFADKRALPPQTDHFLKTFDKNGDQKIDKEEFLTGYWKTEGLLQLFNSNDCDNDGQISIKESCDERFLANPSVSEDDRKLIDANGDDVIDIEEFNSYLDKP